MKVIDKADPRIRFDDAIVLAKEIYGNSISIFFDDKCIDKIVVNLRYGDLSSICAECNKVKIVAEDGHSIYFPIQNKVVEYTIEEGKNLIKGKIL